MFGALLLMHMAWSNGYPLVYSDSGTYIRSGFEGWIPKDRPIFYGYFIRHTSLSTSLWYVAFAQSLLLSYMVFLLFKKHYPQSAYGSYFIMAIVLLSLSTGISFNCSMLIPDLFTALLCLSFILLLKPGELSPFERGFIALLFIFSILTHNSHLIILFFLFLFLLALLAFQQISGWTSGLTLKNLYLCSGLYLLSLLIFPSLNYLIGKKFMISEASHIFLMHKLHDNDLLVRYLNENCEHKNYSICAYKDSLPWDIIWDERSPITKNGDWDQYKEENLHIIKEVLTTYRYAKVLFVKSIHQTLKQFFTFNTGDAPMIDALIKPPLGAIDWHFKEEIREFFSSRQYTKKLNFDAINRTQTIVVYLSLVILFLSYGKGHTALQARHRNAITLMLAFLFCNAFACASFSNVLERYQGRVIWLIPLFAIFVCLDYWQSHPANRKPDTSVQNES